jgi:hypothetical protein
VEENMAKTTKREWLKDDDDFARLSNKQVWNGTHLPTAPIGRWMVALVAMVLIGTPFIH